MGAGAFGIVRRGELKLSSGEKNKVAIKEATLTKCTKEQIKEFMNEARIMRKFSHPNVIQSYGEFIWGLIFKCLFTNIFTFKVWPSVRSR